MTKRPTKQPAGNGHRHRVLRGCQVCEWEDEQIELIGANPDCPWCHAPTVVRKVHATDPDPMPAGKNIHAAELGRLGGLKGGHARAAALTPKQRQASARHAARARWSRSSRQRKSRQKG